MFSPYIWPESIDLLILDALPCGFIDRFASELPFAWETVPIVAWRDAIRKLRQQCKSSHGVAAETVFRSQVVIGAAMV